jgi:hypothetical protein
MTTKITEKNVSNLANAGLQWQSVQTSGFTAAAGLGYFCNTTSAAFTVTLPASATRGDTIALKDYAGTFATNNVTINRNGHNIQGVANNSLISTNRASVVLVYVDTTRGWEFTIESNVANLGNPVFISATGGTITTSGNFKIHTFTGDGSFVVSQVGNSPVAATGGPSSVDYLVVAGGGSAGAPYGAGGGAGGFREGRVLPAPESYTASPLVSPGGLEISVQTYPITVGAGAAGVPATPGAGLSGNNSVFSTITSAGGGGGGRYVAGPQPGRDGFSGGSGGGGGGGAAVGPGGAGGSGNTPPTSPSQGNNGGNGATGPGNYGAAGGGGAGGLGGSGGGQPPTGTGTGVGGIGAGTQINPSPSVGTPGPNGTLRYFAGGGADYIQGTGNGGGYGGGGGTNTAGTANTGGGGGGENVNGSGGKGIVIIRYKYQ